MISRVRGELLSNTQDSVEVMTSGGIAFEVNVPTSVASQLGKVGEEVTLFTYLVIREDEHLLFGFKKASEKEVFLRLISINGVGPKMALSFLSSLSVEELVRAVKTKNLSVLTSISGVGKKTAERLLVELSGKFDDITTTVDAGTTTNQEAVRALLALGINAVVAERAVYQAAQEKSDISTSELIKKALVTAKGG